MIDTWNGKTGAEILDSIQRAKAEWEAAYKRYLDQVDMPAPGLPVNPGVCYRAAMLVTARRMAGWVR
jgi:hypothetical protein